MCGIVASFHWKRAAGMSNEFVTEQFSDQVSRGEDGFGMTLFGKTGRVRTLRNTHIAGAFVDLKLEKSPGILFHHRYPTSTPNWVSQTHPMFVSNKELKSDWYFIHNGIISNPGTCRDLHLDAGYEYTTAYTEPSRVGGTTTTKMNDSEALAVGVVRVLEGKADKVDAIGSAAWVALEVSKETGVAVALHWGRNASNPLRIDHSPELGYVHLSSEGYGFDVEAGKAFSMDLKTHAVTERELVIMAYEPVSNRAHWWDDEEAFDRMMGRTSPVVNAEKKEKKEEARKKSDIAALEAKRALEEARARDQEEEELAAVAGVPTGKDPLETANDELDALMDHVTSCVETAFGQLGFQLAEGQVVTDKDIQLAIDTVVPGVVASLKESKGVINRVIAIYDEEATGNKQATEADVVKQYLGAGFRTEGN